MSLLIVRALVSPILVLGPVTFCIVACGGAAESGEPVRSPAPAKVASAEAPKKPVDALGRNDVLATVDAGLGRFLQRVDVEPELQDGQFQGFRIVGLHPPEFWEGVDLAPGDVITKVNGLPIERETQAYAAFETLRAAKELRVSIIRGGAPRELVLPIRDAAKQATPSAAPPAKAADAG